MNVASLQLYVKALVPPLEAAGAARKIAEDLEKICQGLEPFKDQPLGQFADFLVKAEEYARTGVVSSKGRGRGTPKPVDQEKVMAAAQEVKALCERAVDADFGYADIDAEVARLNKKLSAAEAMQVATEVGAARAKTKKAAMEEIKNMIRGRKRSTEMTESIASV